MIKAEQVTQLFKELKSQRSSEWDSHYQVIGQYVHGLKQDFLAQLTPGMRLNETTNTPIGIFSSRTAASALIGMMWSNGGESVRIEPPDEDIADDPEVKEYFDWANKHVIRPALDDTQAGLSSALDEYALDQISFGTSGVACYGGEKSMLSFESWGIQNLYLIEGKGGKVNGVIRYYKWSLRRVIAEFSIELLSKTLQERLKDPKHLDDKVELIHAIMPRDSKDMRGFGNRFMPYFSVFIELESNHIIRESGYRENPVKVARFRKLATEKYGRSPGMDAIGDILELDFLIEQLSVNAEKSNGPALAVYDDGMLGNGFLNTSADSVTVMDVSGRQMTTGSPVQQLYDVGPMNISFERVSQLYDIISQHFYLDKLLDYNNKQEMTATETVIREKLKMASLGSIFNRQSEEMFDPLMHRAIRVLLADGHLGVMPGSFSHQVAMARGEDVMVIPQALIDKYSKGEDFYTIKYYTPAAKVMEASREESLIELTNYVANVAAVSPEALDNIDIDKAVQMSARLKGLTDVTRSIKEVGAIRQQRQQQMQAQQMPEQLKQGSEAINNLNRAGML